MAAVCHSGVSPCRPAAPGSTIDASDTGRCAMLHMLTRRWWLFVLRGVAAMLFGIFAIVWPGATLLVYDRLTCDEHFELFGRAYGLPPLRAATHQALFGLLAA